MASTWRARRVLTSAALAVLGLFGTAWSQSPSLPETTRLTLSTDPDSVLAEELARIPGDPLGLEEAIDQALSQATAIGEAEASLRAAMAVVRREKGPFDPELFASYLVDVQDTPSSTPFAGNESDETTTSLGARIRFSTGTRLEATFDTRRLETDFVFESLHPKYETSGRLALTQPLLKGLGPATRAPLSAAERDLEGAQSQYESAVLVVRADVEQAYWALYAAERNLAVERLVRDRAESFVELARRRSGVGLVGPNEMANAEVFLAQEKQAVLDRQEELGAISDRLATLLGRRPAPGLDRFQSTAEPPLRFDMVPPDSAVQLSLQHNHDLMVVEKRVESLRALERGAGWDALPTLDLVGSLGGNGLSGTGPAKEVIIDEDTLRTPAIDGGLGDAWSQVFGRDFPTWSLGLRLSVPLGLREGRGERDRLRAEVLRAEKQMEALRRGLEESVRSRHRELSNAEQRFEAARQGVDASLRQVRIGMLEYESGRTTAFEIVRLAEDVASAQQRYSQALVRAAQAASELRLLTAGRFPALPGP